MQDAAGQAQEKAQQAAGQARDRVRDEVDTRSTQAGQQAETVANDVRSVGQHLRAEGKDKPAELADKTAARVADLGDYLKRSDDGGADRDAYGRRRSGSARRIRARRAPCAAAAWPGTPCTAPPGNVAALPR